MNAKLPRLIEHLSEPVNVEEKFLHVMLTFFNEADAFEKWMNQESGIFSKFSTVKLPEITKKHSEIEKLVEEKKNEIEKASVKGNFPELIQYSKKRWENLERTSKYFREHCKRISDVQKLLEKVDKSRRLIEKERLTLFTKLSRSNMDIQDMVIGRLRRLEVFDQEINSIRNEARVLHPYAERFKLRSNKSYIVIDTLSQEHVGKLVDISEGLSWKIKNDAGEEFSKESITLSLLPPNTEIQNLGEQFSKESITFSLPPPNTEMQSQAYELDVLFRKTKCGLLERKANTLLEIREVKKMKAERH